MTTQKLCEQEGIYTMANNPTAVTTTATVLERGFALFEPRAFKPKGATEATGPAKYSAGIDYDKATEQDAIRAILEAQQAAIQQAIERDEWDESKPGSMAFVDADKTKVKESKDSKKLVTLSVKKPTLKGRYVLSAKSKLRPDVRYMAIKNTIAGPTPVKEKLPVPVDGMSDDELRKIKNMWDKFVFAGQNVQLGITFRAYTLDTGAQGVSAQLDSVLILGGGTPLGTVPFSAHFPDSTMNMALEWLQQHAPNYRLPVIGEQKDTPAADAETGEIQATGQPSDIFTPVKKAPSRQFNQFDDEFGGDFDDEPLA